jgi:hypothetical protein
MALVAVAMMGQEPVITFEKTVHDFGKIHEEDGRVSTIFTFKNEGMSPLVLSNVRASCGCTTPTWTKEPVEPGQSGEITVTYNANGRPGHFEKTVTVTSNATEPTKRIYIKGEVLPKQVKPVNQYTVAVGALSMKSRTLDLGTIKKGAVLTGELEYANLTDVEHKVDLATNASDAMLISQTTLATVQPNETGKFVLGIDTKRANVFGPVEIYVYVVVDGKRNVSEPFQLVIKADIEEDFSEMTIEQKQEAPILETQKEFAITQKLAAGKTFKYMFPIKNSGVNPLEIHRVLCNDSHLIIKEPKAIKSGKKGAVAVTINTRGLEPGAYSRQLTIISNDYQHPRQKVTFKWEVE